MIFSVLIISKRNKSIISSFFSIILIGSISIGISINPVYPTIAPSTISPIDTSQIVFITAANENNQPVANCLEKDFDEQDECVNDGDNIIFTITVPTDTVTQQCQLNFAFDNHPRDTPFTCTSSLTINSIPDNLGKLQLTVTATNQGNERQRAVFQWLQSDGGGGGGDQADVIVDGQSDAAIDSSTSNAQPGTNEIDSPFKVCFPYTSKIKLPPATATGDLTDANVVHVPSIATYTIQGDASIDRFKNELDGQKTFKIRIYHDISADEPVGVDNKFSLESGATKFTGKFIADELTDKSLRYNVKKIFTTCEFISLVDPTVPRDVALPSKPIGEVRKGEIKKEFNGDHNIRGHLPDEDVIALGGRIVSFDSPSLALNPLFDQCGNSIADPEVAIYDIVGTAKLKDINNKFREKVTVKIFNDINLAKGDLVNIFDNNNRYVKAKLILEAGTSKAEVIDFDIKELSTQCSDVSFSQHPLLSFKDEYF